MPEEASPEKAAVAQHHREQPEGGGELRVVGECGPELREVDLRLHARSGLEAVLEVRLLRWAQFLQCVLNRRIAPGVAELSNLPEQARSGEAWKGADTIGEERDEGLHLGGSGISGAVAGRLQSPRDVLAHGLGVQIQLTGDG